VNARQRRKYLRASGSDTRRYNLLWKSFERWLDNNSRWNVQALEGTPVVGAHYQDLYSEWLQIQNDVNFTILLDDPEGEPEWIIEAIQKEANRRVEIILVTVKE